MSWAVDLDYVHQLSPEEKAWMAQFLDRHYGGDFRGPSEAEWTDAARRAAYRRKNSANRDLFAHDESSGEDPLRDQMVEVNMEESIPKRRGRPPKAIEPEFRADIQAETKTESSLRSHAKPIEPKNQNESSLRSDARPMESVAWLALHHTKKGWVVLSAKSIGTELAEETILHGPMPHASARNFFRLEAERRYLRRPR